MAFWGTCGWRAKQSGEVGREYCTSVDGLIDLIGRQVVMAEARRNDGLKAHSEQRERLDDGALRGCLAERTSVRWGKW